MTPVEGMFVFAGVGYLLNSSNPKLEVPALILLGIILIIIGLLVKLSILYAIGIVLLVIGVILWILGTMGREIGGRRHYY